MGPTFHVLRDIRAGKLHTRQTRRESAWSLANHQGYLSACEMHSSESLERSTQNQLTFLKKFAAAWESRDKMTLFRLMSECEAFFDPNRPSTLVHFTGLGGIDLFVRLLCDNAEWLTSPSYGLLLFHPDEGINVYNTMLRVLTELLVCHNDIGWYLYDRHRGLIFRLMELMKVERLRDSAIMLLEHIISVVGPIVHIPSHPDLIETIRGLSDGGLAAMCRVLALLVVPGVMTDQLWKSKRMEPFPQCLVRIEKIQTIVDDNVNWIIQESGLVLRLLDLGKVRSSGVRIFQGNRTMTVIAPEPGVAAAVAGAAGSLPIPTMGAAAAALSTGAQTILSHLMGSANSAAMPGNATPFTPQSGTSMGNSTQAFGATEDFEGDDDDYEDVDEDDMFNGGSNLVLSEEMLNNPAALQQALQHILASVAQQPQQAAAPPAAPTVPVPSSTPGGAAPASPGPPQAAGPAPPIPAPTTEQQTLQTIAESLSHDMPPINGLDSINFSWFCGRPDTKGRWRFQSMRVDPAEYERTFGLLTPPEAHQRAGAKFFETLQKDEVNRKAKASPKQQRAMAVAEQQAIVNSQSEIFFVLNSIMVTCHYTKAWHVLASYNTLQRCLDVFDSVFFVNQQSTSIHASPPSRNSTNNTANTFATDSVHTVDRFESSHAVAHRAGKFYETFWNPCPTTCIVTPAAAAAAGKQKVVPLGVGTNAHHNADVDDDDFVTNLRDDPAATTREGDLSDDESEDSMDHRHDPDTLRKLELLRIIHEYCNAQDRGEWSRLTQTLLPTTSVNGVSRTSSTPLMHDLAKKVASQLITGVEDACTETVGAHALESILRCLGFRSSTRRRLASGASGGEDESASLISSNNTHEAVAHILLPHLIGERIFNGITGSSGTAHALSPWKRVDAFFAVMGETCKYNSASIRLLVRYLKGDIAVPSTPTYLGTPVTQPNATGAASALQSAPIARGQHDTVLSVFRYRLRRFGVDTNLFIRCMCLSITSELASPINYVWKPLNDSEASTTPANVVAIVDELKDSRSYLPDERVLEPTKNQMQRIYYVRELSRKLIEEFTQRFMQSSSNSEEDTESGDIRKMQWSRDALAAIFKAPSFYDATPAGRPFPNLFSEEELCILHPCSALPRAGLSSELRNALVGTFGDTSAAPSGATAEADQQDLDFIAESIFQAPQELAYSMLSMLNAETIENTERLCVVTSTMLLFLRASRLGGQAAVDALLDSVADIARARREKYLSRRKRLQRSGGSVAALAPCQAHGGAGQCNIETPLEHQCDNFVFFGHCLPNTVVRDYYDLHGSDFFKNFFRLLCVWLAHYSCSQRYVETLYYCTEVPFGEWKMLALYLFRTIPNYFFAAV
ncbi:Hypothetical protein, putative [Bodo saltans]|uniref:Uncharacterized protein n=1 Tax=Bodo saltans TaxID=75058 RepID=A0A0S4J7W6_BODSA|nr:Hypothetical protein, putative [Bodo saltans]|eukprot:CUG86588.1 Hypothetical protein, putative [Bodo saltans]